MRVATAHYPPNIGRENRGNLGRKAGGKQEMREIGHKSGRKARENCDVGSEVIALIGRLFCF